MATRITAEQLADAVAKSSSIRQVLMHLGRKEAGGNYETIRRWIKRDGLDTSHFTGQAWNRGKQMAYGRPISDYLEAGVPISSHRLKQRLLREKIFEHRCNGCGLSQWRDQPVPLELEHIDGDHSNNALSNLELLCPNCHAQTATYRGLNKGRAA